jgi:hypothetical protein
MLVKQIWSKNKEEAAALAEARRVVVCIDLTPELAHVLNLESADSKKTVPDLIGSALEGIFTRRLAK